MLRTTKLKLFVSRAARPLRYSTGIRPAAVHAVVMTAM
jgi:hypothetical protein